MIIDSDFIGFVCLMVFTIVICAYGIFLLSGDGPDEDLFA